MDDLASASRNVEPINDRSSRFYAAELKPSQSVPVGGKYAELARTIVKEETNPLLQARAIFDWIIGHVGLSANDRARPRSSENGESERCLSARAGGSADMSALFASLARSLQVPTRVVYGALLGADGRPVSDSESPYAWAEFFALGLGWIPVDLALAKSDPSEARRTWHLGNLDARRIVLSVGRDLTLEPKQDGPPVDAMRGVYAEIDGKPHAACERKLVLSLAPSK